MLKGILLILGGTIFAQLIALASTPFLTRLFSPEDFGYLAIAVSLITILSSVGNLKLDLALQNELCEERVKDIISTSFLFNNVLIALFGLLIFILNSFNFESPFFNLLNDSFFVILLSSFTIFTFNLLVAKKLREKKYSSVAKAKSLVVLSMVLMQFVFFVFFDDALLLGYFFSYLIPIFYLGFHRTLKSSIIFKFEIIRKVIVRSKPFIIYTAPSALINSIGNQLPILFFSVIYGVKMVGFFMISQKLISSPVKMIADALSKVLYSNTITLEKEGLKKYLNLMGLLFLSSLPALLFIQLYIYEITSYLLGPGWDDAATFSRYAIFLAYFTLIGMPIYNISLKIGLNKPGLYFEMIMIACRVLVLFVVVYFSFNEYDAVFLYFTGCSTVWFFYIAYIYIQSFSFNKAILIRLIIYFMIIVLAISAMLLLIESLLLNSFLMISLCFLFVSVLYVYYKKNFC